MLGCWSIPYPLKASRGQGFLLRWRMLLLLHKLKVSAWAKQGCGTYSLDMDRRAEGAVIGALLVVARPSCYNYVRPPQK